MTVSHEIGATKGRRSITIDRETPTDGYRENGWNVRASPLKDLCNPIRRIVDEMVGQANPDKSLISLAQGDPTVFGHLLPPKAAMEEVVGAFAACVHNGYTASAGMVEARDAVAARYSEENRRPLQAEDVFMTVGCSEALSHSFAALAVDGANILLPKPGFPLYETLCHRHGIKYKFYELDPENGWEIKLDDVRRLRDENTVAIVVNNPSNPCGAVFSEKHLRAICKTCEALHLPIIADEVYEDVFFDKIRPFKSIAKFSGRVPVMAVSALSKRWLTPGWRIGWLVLHDYDHILQAAGVKLAINNLCQVSLGPPTPIQAAIPGIFQANEEIWLERTLTVLKSASTRCIERCARVRGLSVPCEPQGAMYMLLKMNPDAFNSEDGTYDDVVFAKRLLSEEAVLVLPGTCFHAPGYLRLVITVPDDELQEAWDRIEAFCERHSVERNFTDSPKEDVLVNGLIGKLQAMPVVDSVEDLQRES